MSVVQRKICLLGQFSVGKTSLIRRFVDGKFSDDYLSTIGVNISRKQLQLNRPGNQAGLTLLIWDLAGGEKFSAMFQSYYRGAAGAIVVGDLTRPETLTSISDCVQTFWSVCPAAPVVVVGNKVDLLPQPDSAGVTLAQIAAPLHAPWFLSSAKTGENVDPLFQTMGELIVTGSEAVQA